MPETCFASIAIELQARQRALYFELARLLKERHGSQIHFYVRSDDEVRGIERIGGHGEIWDTVTNDNMIVPGLRATNLDPTVVVTRAREFEAKIGETYNALSFSNRQLGRGFSPGSFNYPRARYAAEASYVQMLHAYNETLGFWERQIQERQITLLIDGGKEMAVSARAHGLPYRWFQSARYKTHWFWAIDEYQNNPGIEWYYRRLPPDAAQHLTNIYRAASAKYARFHADRRLPRMIVNTAAAVARHLYMKSRGYQKAESISVAGIVRFAVNIRRGFGRAARLSTTTLENLRGQPFAYFPLHKEPETSLLLAAPENSFQHALILQIARDLPAGVRLAVKENLSAIGRRPDNFYDQIAELKNVVFLDLGAEPLETARQAACVVTINGTAGMEAAIIGRPVISFSHRVPYRFLPHVRVVQAPRELRPAIDWALSQEIDLARAARDGARYLAALSAASFDMGNFLLDWSDNRGANREKAEIAYNGLMATFDLAKAERRPDAGSLVGTDHTGFGCSPVGRDAPPGLHWTA